MNKLIQNAIVLCVTMALLFVLLEAGLRASGSSTCYVYPEGMFVADENVCYRPAADFSGDIDAPEYESTFSTDSDGRRDDSVAEADKTILLLGDSFTFGVGVNDDETFAAVLEQMLGGEYDVINTGVPSYDTWRENIVLEQLGKELEPDIVILAFYNNDLNDNDNERACTTHVRDGILVDKATAEQNALLFKLRIFLNANVQSYCFARTSALNIQSMLKERNTSEALGASMLTYFSEDEYTGKTKERWENAERLLLQTKNSSDSLGTRLIILNIPDQLQVETEVWRPITDRYGVGPADFDLERLNREMLEFGAENNITIVDPLARLRAADTKLYYDYDRHIDATGNRIIAEALYEQIISSQP